MYKLIRWKNKYVSGDVPIMKEIILFNFISISRHFKGFQDGGFRVEYHNKRGDIYLFNFKDGLKKWGNLGIDKKRLTIRLNVPIITFEKVDLNRKFRNVEVI